MPYKDKKTAYVIDKKVLLDSQNAILYQYTELPSSSNTGLPHYHGLAYLTIYLLSKY